MTAPAPGSPPALCAFVAGPCELWVDTGTDKALEFLGWSVNGVSIDQIAFHGPVHSDENGGAPGPPVDYQLFGYQHRITVELAKFQETVIAKLDGRFNSTGAFSVGMLLGCTTSSFRLLLNAPNFIRNYLAVVLTDPIQLSPVGSQASRARISFTANVPTGSVMFDTTIT